MRIWIIAIFTTFSCKISYNLKRFFLDTGLHWIFWQTHNNLDNLSMLQFYHLRKSRTSWYFFKKIQQFLHNLRKSCERFSDFNHPKMYYFDQQSTLHFMYLTIVLFKGNTGCEYFIEKFAKIMHNFIIRVPKT